jgi:gliding motility-associated-like protein
MRNIRHFFLMTSCLIGLVAKAQSPCDSFTIKIEPLAGTFLYCPASVGTESFRGVASYDVDTIVYDPNQLLYSWQYQGVGYSGNAFSRLFEEPGAYPLTLKVVDPSNNCTDSITEVIKVGTIPTFTGTMPSLDVACAKDEFILTGRTNLTTWTGFPTSVTETVAIPQDGTFYESHLDFNVFEEGAVVESEMDIERICLSIDHVDFGPIGFEIECPNGTVVRLKTFGEGGANLGEPVLWDNTTPGKGYQYCFSPTPLYGTMLETTPAYHAYTDMAGNYYFNATYLPAGSYTPEEPLSNLIGCPLNGQWTMRVADNLSTSNGFVHSWSLFFSESYYPDSLIFTPEVVTEQWFRDNTRLTGNPSAQSIDTEGDYSFRFEMADNFGCLYDTTVMVTVLPLPKAEILSDLEMPVCEGDSTFLRVMSLSGSTFDWVYQWMLGGSDYPGRIFDTIMAKEPAAFAVMITDTITGCSDIFNFDFSSQNCDLTVPNVFTPNADGINDVFEVLNLEHYPVAQIVIFNRWGKKVFEHTDYYNNWWDGGGHPDGVYFYVIKYSRMGELKHAEGSVTIIR